MTVPRIWKNNYVKEDSSTDLSPGAAPSKVACTTPMASPPLPCSPSTGASKVHEVANGITSLFCTHPSCGPPRSAHPHDCSIFQIYASHPWAPISVMFTSMLFLPCSRHTWTSGPLHWLFLLSGTISSQLTAWHGLFITTISGRPFLASPCTASTGNTPTHFPCYSPWLSLSSNTAFSLIYFDPVSPLPECKMHQDRGFLFLLTAIFPELRMVSSKQ